MVSTVLTAASRQAVMPLVARRAALQAPRGARFVHIENNIDTALPFKTGKKYKTRLAIGTTAFLATGFGLPFFAAWFQLSKAV